MPTYTTPTRPISSTDPFFGRFQIREGLTIVRQGGVLGYLQIPMPEDLAGLVAGVDYFLGGREYQVSVETLAELTSMGFA